MFIGIGCQPIERQKGQKKQYYIKNKQPNEATWSLGDSQIGWPTLSYVNFLLVVANILSNHGSIVSFKYF